MSRMSCVLKADIVFLAGSDAVLAKRDVIQHDIVINAPVYGYVYLKYPGAPGGSGLEACVGPAGPCAIFQRVCKDNSPGSCHQSLTTFTISIIEFEP